MPGFEVWTYERRPLYVAQVILTNEGRMLGELTFRFGMRAISMKDRNYQLNGRNLWLRGSNLVSEWDWGDTITGHEFDYLVTEAREMSMNFFRTHTRPPAAALGGYRRRARDDVPSGVPGALQLPGLPVHVGGLGDLAW
jgi:beta-galactosidase/beta-glucuronidase